MIYLLFQALGAHQHYVPVLNLLKYLTFRTGLSLFTAQLVVQFAIAAVAVFAMIWFGKPAAQVSALNTSLAFPLFKNLLWNLGWFYLAFGAVVIVGASNAVNLTDGLDGLAIAPVMIAAAAFGLIAYVVGNVKYADYLQIHFVSGVGELSVFCGAMIGAGLGFLWYNAPPAKIFMAPQKTDSSPTPDTKWICR